MGSTVEDAINLAGTITTASLVLTVKEPGSGELENQFAVHAPASLLNTTAIALRRGLREATMKIARDMDCRNLIIPDYDVHILDALRDAEFEGRITILPPPSVCPADLDRMRTNAPRGLSVTISEPGVMPTYLNPTHDAVAALAFDLGSGQMLVRENTARFLRPLRALNFLGDVTAVNPLDVPIIDRPRGWETVEARLTFRKIATPNGLTSLNNH